MGTTINKTANVVKSAATSTAPQSFPPQPSLFANVSDLVGKRHLIYHIWPNRNNDTWRWNVKELLKYIKIFNGSRSISIVTDGNSCSLAEVQKEFGDVRIDNWLHNANNPILGEVVSFAALIKLLPIDGITFYAHAKGVSYKDGEVRQQTSKIWAELLYAVNLSKPPQLLKNFPIVGAFKRPGQFNNKQLTNWHYSGTFFWFRNNDISSFKSPEQNYYGVEVWPSVQFKPESMGNLYGGGNKLLYDAEEILYWYNTYRNGINNKVSLVTTCKDRVEHLKQSLPRMLEQDVDEVILVNYGCPHNCGKLPISSKLRKIDVTFNASNFCPNRARNIGIRKASGDTLILLDADQLVQPDFATNAVNQLRQYGYDMLKFTFAGREFGQCIFKRYIWDRLRGYDESFISYGYDDIDFYRRTMHNNFIVGNYENHGITIIHHSDEVRREHLKFSEETKEQNFAKMQNHDRPINPNGYGLME